MRPSAAPSSAPPPRRSSVLSGQVARPGPRPGRGFAAPRPVRAAWFRPYPTGGPPAGSARQSATPEALKRATAGHPVAERRPALSPRRRRSHRQRQPTAPWRGRPGRPARRACGRPRPRWRVRPRSGGAARVFWGRGISPETSGGSGSRTRASQPLPRPVSEVATSMAPLTP